MFLTIKLCNYAKYQLIGLVGTVFANVIPETLKMVLDTSLLNTQRYKVCIKGKVEQSRERSSTLPLHLIIVTIEKGTFGLPSNMVANFTFTYAKLNCLFL